jgi:hypothetical protein
VQDEILGKWTTEELRVYTVWLPFLGGTRGAIDGTLLADPRVRHYWDEHAVTSQWFGSHLPGQSGFLWDAYVVNGADAEWSEEPPEPVEYGATVIGDSASLERAIQSLLGPPDRS